ncbi:unnamed protein product [Sympodiomycopsis kandeliae]
MKSALFGAAGIVSTLVAGATAAQQLTIHPEKSKDSKFGIATFIESNINYATDGGLYAELIRNRAFQEEGQHTYWQATQGTTLSQTKENPLSDALPNSSKVSSSSNGAFGVRNVGFFGIPVKPQKYTVSFQARAKANAQVTARAGLYSASDANKEFAGVDVPLALTTQWKEFKATIDNKATAPNPNNTFGLNFPKGTGEVQFNLVSVFPQTWQGTVARPDLAQALDDLHAPYTRFPGGNTLEGNSFADRFKWRNAVGPLKNRPGRKGTWAGWDTDGYGLHEMFDLFEKQGSSPILGVWAAYSLDRKSVPKDQLQPYIDEAIDQLHYIKDPQGSSDLARQREANGRAQPWKLDHIQIGNEDWFAKESVDSYQYRYPAFASAIKNVFPQLKIMSSSPYYNDKKSLESIDQHDYNTPKNFFGRFQEHDSWPRNGTLIWELEYAVINSGECGEAPAQDLYGNSCRLKNPTLIASLAEAAFTAGMERNGDLIAGAAYAPLFHNNAASQWTPDMILFDHNTVALSPSYWVQYGFSNNRIDKILSVDHSEQPGPIYWSAGTKGKNLVIKVINSSGNQQPVTMKLASGTFGGQANVWGISNKDPKAVNLISNPNNVKPTTGSTSASGNSLTVNVPAYAFQVITVPLKA